MRGALYDTWRKRSYALVLQRCGLASGVVDDHLFLFGGLFGGVMVFLRILAFVWMLPILSLEFPRSTRCALYAFVWVVVL
jgi:hypothetical protein